MTETTATETTATETTATETTATETTATETAVIQVATPRVATKHPRKHGLALVWWTAAIAWAYFTFGQLVVAVGYPETLAVIGVVAVFALAGRRVRGLFADAKAVFIAAMIATLMSAVAIILGPALLVTLVPERAVALVALLLVVMIAFVALRLIRRRERTNIPQTSAKTGATSIVVWLMVLAFTAVAVVLAARQ